MNTSSVWSDGGTFAKNAVRSGFQSIFWFCLCQFECPFVSALPRESRPWSRFRESERLFCGCSNGERSGTSGPPVLLAELAAAAVHAS